MLILAAMAMRRGSTADRLDPLMTGSDLKWPFRVRRLGAGTVSFCPPNERGHQTMLLAIKPRKRDQIHAEVRNQLSQTVDILAA